MRAKDLTVLITGAARGVGKEIAMLFLKEGAKVAMCDIDRQRLDRTLRYIKGIGKIDYIYSRCFDVRKREELKSFIDDSALYFNGIDIFINATTLFSYGKIEDFEEEGIELMIETNLTASIMATKYITPYIKRSKNGSILFIGSSSSHLGHEELSIFNATKGALNAFAKSLAIELANAKVRVNTISSGLCDSPLLHEYLLSQNEDKREEIKRLESLHPIEGLNKLSDIAETALFLTQKSTRRITAQDIVIDGGISQKGHY